MTPLTTPAAIGSGLVAGCFFAFSAVVMPALRRLPPADAARAMQTINRVAVQPPLMIALFGTAAVSVAAVVPAVRALDEASARWTLAGSAFYIVGGIVVTIAANVPRNEHLAAHDPVSAGTAWPAYAAGWTFWNHVRTLGCVAAGVCFVLARRVG